MENNHFDDWIKKEMNEYEVPFQPNDWAMMEDKLDQDFDDWIKEGIEASTVPFGESDWGAMEKRLEEEDQFQKRYFTIKGLEVLILALVLFTVAQYIPYDVASSAAYEKGISPTQELETLPDNNLNNKKEIPPANPSLEKIEEEKEKATTKPSKVIFASKATAPIQNNTSTSVEKERNQPKARQSVTPTKTVVSFPEKQVSEKELIAAIEKGEVKSRNQKESDREATMDLNPMKLAGRPLLAIDRLEKPVFNQTLALDRPEIKPLKPKSRLRLGMYISPDANLVFTPYNEKIESSYQTANLGFSGGFVVGFSKGRWETETGVEYALVTYRPKEVIEIKGSIQENFFAESLEDIEFDLVSLPLNFSYNFLYHKGWKFYAKTGGTLHVVALSKLYQRQVIFDNITPFDTGTNSSSQQRPSLNTDGGLFAEGTLNDNYFVTANLGLGAERLLSNNFSVFIEPSLSHTIHGAKIGPNNDKINSISLNMGAKITL